MIPNNRASEHNFALVPKQGLARSAFRRTKKMMDTQYFDYLYPIYCRLYNPGDSTRISLQSFARLPASVVPLMDNMYYDMQAFKIPARILQKSFKRLYANEQEYPTQDNTTLVTHNMDYGTLPDSGPTDGMILNGSLYDKFDWPTMVNLRTGNTGGTSAPMHLLAYKPLAYNMVWNYWYRDENLQSPVYFDDDDAPYDFDNFVLLKRNMRPDYFQSLLKAPLKGDAPLVPLDGAAVVELLSTTTNQVLLKNAADGSGLGDGSLISNFGNGSFYNSTASEFVQIDPNGTLYADLSTQLAGFTINDFRLSYSVQLLLEADNRSGTRFAESMYHRWGVVIPDAFLTQPEYIAYATTDFNVHIVPQTTPIGGADDFANLSAYTTQRGFLKFVTSFQEPCYLLILGSARGNVTYQQGLNREDTIQTRFDFIHPEFAHLGMQTVYKYELFVTGTDTDMEPLGYSDYGDSYRFSPSTVRGDFRSNATASLDSYHLAIDYSAQPSMNASYSVSDTPIERNIPYAESAPPILVDYWLEETVVTSMPMFSVPGLGRHI